MFGKDIRAIVPQLSMSAGTMIALSCKEILMGKHSNLGPIDPQFGGIPAQEVLSEFKRAKKEIKDDPSSTPLWKTIITKYPPTFLARCKYAVDWSEELVKEWLKSNMCNDDLEKAEKILTVFSDHSRQKSHSRHISIQKCKDSGLLINELESEENEALQDAILTLHHAFMHTFSNSSAVKIVENHTGATYFEDLKNR